MLSVHSKTQNTTKTKHCLRILSWGSPVFDLCLKSGRQKCRTGRLGKGSGAEVKLSLTCAFAHKGKESEDLQSSKINEWIPSFKNDNIITASKPSFDFSEVHDFLWKLFLAVWTSWLVLLGKPIWSLIFIPAGVSRNEISSFNHEGKTFRFRCSPWLPSRLSLCYISQKNCVSWLPRTAKNHREGEWAVTGLEQMWLWGSGHTVAPTKMRVLSQEEERNWCRVNQQCLP